MESRKCGDEQMMYYTTGWEPFSRQISLAFSNHPFCPPATMLCSNHRHFHLERELVIAHFENNLYVCSSVCNVLSVHIYSQEKIV